MNDPDSINAYLDQAPPWESAPSNVVPIREDVSARDADKEPAALLDLIDPSSWADTLAPERSWRVKDYIPDRQATLLTGKGAAGKSLLSQQQCTCLALGLPFLGLETVETVSLYITCEDDADELHRRQKAICTSLAVPVASLSGKLHLLSLQGEMGSELATFDHDGRMRSSPRFDQIVETCKAHNIRFIVLDNTAHLFTGNENDRHQVAAFINLCNRLALAIDGAVVIVGHPNKAGDSYSGSTAWENQVRSRLFMEIPVDENGNAPNPDMRLLRREKANYAQRGGDLEFLWRAGAFVLATDIPSDERRTIEQVAQDGNENALFLKCLAACTAKKRAVSHINGINYYATIFARMTEGDGAHPKVFERAFERLLHLGKIELEATLWKGPNRHWKTGIREVDGGVKSAPTPRADPAPTPRADPRQPSSQVIENIAPTPRAPTPLYTTYNGGAGLEAEPPPWMDDVPDWDPDDQPPQPRDLDWRDNPILNGKDF